MRHQGMLVILGLLLLASCATVTGPGPTPVDPADVESIAVYSVTGEDVIRSGDERFGPSLTELLATVPNFNLQAQCIYGEDEVSAMKQRESMVELTFKAPQRIAIGVRVPKEQRESIPVDGQGFRTFEVKGLLFILSGEHQGHLFVPSDAAPTTWGCWAMLRGKEIDTRWIEAVEQALGR